MAAVGYYTTNTLIADIKRRAMLPTSSSTFTNADFLSFANTELKIGLVPSILSLHEEYYVYPETVALEASISRYEIPYRAIGGKLRDLFYKDSNENLFEMSRISPDDKAIYQNISTNSNYYYYYLEGNNVVLCPSVGDSTTGSLVFTYYLRPNDLVEENRVGVITEIATNTGAGTTTYTMSTCPAGFNVNVLFDLLQAKPGHKIRKYDLVASAVNIAAKTITFSTDDLDENTEVGDHVAYAGECIIPQCPADLHPILAQRASARCLEALGDTQGLTNANTKLQEMETKSIALIDNRVVGAVQKVVNRSGFLRGGRGRW